MEEIDFDEERRKTVKQLAQRRPVPNRGCSPSVFLTMAGQVICVIALVVGLVVFNVQWRRYGAAWGGDLVWQCKLVSCELRYAYHGTQEGVNVQIRRGLMKLLKRTLPKRFIEPADEWIEGFVAGNAESFPPLWNLELCETSSFRSWLFSGFCESSMVSGHLVGGTTWSIVKKSSRLGFALICMSILMSILLFWYVAVDHQAIKNTKEKKPRWAVSELKTGRFRGVAKVCAAMAPICTAGCVMQYRLSIQNFERVGGILKQTLSMLAKESGEVQMPWGCVWYLIIALVQLALAIGLLRGPLRKPEIPLAMDVVDIQLETWRTRQEEMSSQAASSSTTWPQTTPPPLPPTPTPRPPWRPAMPRQPWLRPPARWPWGQQQPMAPPAPAPVQPPGWR